MKKVSAEHNVRSSKLIALYWQFVDSGGSLFFSLLYVIGPLTNDRHTRFKFRPKSEGRK